MVVSQKSPGVCGFGFNFCAVFIYDCAVMKTASYIFLSLIMSHNKQLTVINTYYIIHNSMADITEVRIIDTVPFFSVLLVGREMAEYVVRIRIWTDGPTTISRAPTRVVKRFVKNCFYLLNVPLDGQILLVRQFTHTSRYYFFLTYRTIVCKYPIQDRKMRTKTV